MTSFTTMSSPVGDLLLTAQDGALTRLYMCDGHEQARIDPAWTRDDGALAPAVAKVDEYFAGERRTFDLAVAPAGGAFEQRVWSALRQIPYGETVSYGPRPGRGVSPTAVTRSRS